MQLALGLILSAGIGLSLGLIGGGGSIVTVPVLVYVLGVPAHRAIGMSLGRRGVDRAGRRAAASPPRRRGLAHGLGLRGERNRERLPRLEA